MGLTKSQKKNFKKKAAKLASSTEKKNLDGNGKPNLDQSGNTNAKRSNRSRFTTMAALHESEQDFLFSPSPSSVAITKGENESKNSKDEEIDYIVDDQILQQHLEDIKEEYQSKIQQIVGKSQS